MIKSGQIIVKVGKTAAQWIAKNWKAITFHRETSAGIQIRNLDKLAGVAENVQKSQQQKIDWKLKTYQKLGLKPEEIREKLMAEIEQSTDPLSILHLLAEKGVILDIQHELPMLPAAEEVEVGVREHPKKD